MAPDAGKKVVAVLLFSKLERVPQASTQGQYKEFVSISYCCREKLFRLRWCPRLLHFLQYFGVGVGGVRKGG